MSDESLSPSEGVQNAFDMYGRIKEGVHVAGYSFERACSHLEWLLGEGRWKLGGRFDNVNTFLESIKLDQFRVVTNKRKRIAKRIKELQPKASQRAIAKVVGVDETTIRRDLGSKPAANAAPAEEEPAPAVPSQPADAANAAPKPTLSGSEAAKTAERKATQKQRKKEKASREQQTRSVVDSIVNLPEPEPEAVRAVSPGDWFQLGAHLLYCGDTSSPAFYENIPEADFAFADPPYGVKADEWDEVFYWNHDWLIDKAPVVAVTPGQPAIFEFARKTGMPYRNSMASWISNGMTLSEFGYQNWIYIAFFAREGISIYRQCQDVIRCTIDISKTAESSHRGRKPEEMMSVLFDRFLAPGLAVIDPFLGSGTTLLVAEKHSAVCYGGELSPEYCQHIIARWETLTGQEAKQL